MSTGNDRSPLTARRTRTRARPEPSINRPTTRSPTIAGLLKMWLTYAGMGVVFAAIFYLTVGDKPRPEPALAVFATFVVIGTIIVGTAAWGLVRMRKGGRDGF